MCTVNSSYLGDSTILNSPSSAPADSLRHSPSNPSPPHQDDVHSPSMEITSSTSEVAKRPATSGLNGDDVKSGSKYFEVTSGVCVCVCVCVCAHVCFQVGITVIMSEN